MKKLRTIVGCGALALAAVGSLLAGCDRSQELVVGHVSTNIPASGGQTSGSGGTGGQISPTVGGADSGVTSAGAGQGGGGALSDAATTTASLQPCGTGTSPCPADEYCSFAGVEACGQGVLGQCRQRPAGCSTDCLSPMPCACNGQRYCNECVAQADGFDVGPDMVCQLRHCGSWLGISCADSEFCDFPDLLCGAGLFGNCLVRSNISVCPTNVDPICACDGMQYNNECLANVNGFDRAEACP